MVMPIGQSAYCSAFAAPVYGETICSLEKLSETKIIAVILHCSTALCRKSTPTLAYHMIFEARHLDIGFVALRFFCSVRFGTAWKCKFLHYALMLSESRSEKSKNMATIRLGETYALSYDSSFTFLHLNGLHVSHLQRDREKIDKFIFENHRQNC
jgi:hypothetical protein